MKIYFRGTGIPADGYYLGYASTNLSISRYTVGTSVYVSGTFPITIMVNVSSHTSITLSNISPFNSKAYYGIAADGTRTSLSVNGGTFNCSAYDYIFGSITSGGSGGIEFTVNN